MSTSDEDKIPSDEEAGEVFKKAFEDAAANNELKEDFDNLVRLISSIANDESAMETLREHIVRHYGE